MSHENEKKNPEEGVTDEEAQERELAARFPWYEEFRRQQNSPVQLDDAAPLPARRETGIDPEKSS